MSLSESLGLRSSGWRVRVRPHGRFDIERRSEKPCCSFGFRVQGLGFRGLGFRGFWGLGFGFRALVFPTSAPHLLDNDGLHNLTDSPACLPILSHGSARVGEECTHDYAVSHVQTLFQLLRARARCWRGSFAIRCPRLVQSAVLPYYMSKIVVEAGCRTLNPKPGPFGRKPKLNPEPPLQTHNTPTIYLYAAVRVPDRVYRVQQSLLRRPSAFKTL